jgi:hypothetical protein
MLKAYVGVLSKEGLTLIQTERDESLSLVRRSVRSDSRRVGFWAVLDDTAAQYVEALFVVGQRREAMLALDRAAREMGRILPSDPVDSLH